MRNITATSNWEPLAGTDLVIEAVIEREDIKREVFRQLAERLRPNAVLASNTSALSITRIAETTPHPEPRRWTTLLQPRSPHAPGGSGTKQDFER